MFQFNTADLGDYMANESFTASKKITPGPYRATKLWNGIIKLFRNEMVCKKHRKHFKTYQNCFTASEAVDFLHKQLQVNTNIGKDVSRSQTIQLLKKFLKNHVIEDVSGKWGTENFEDDNKLFRFQSTIPIAKHLRKPLSTIDENTDLEKTSKKGKRKSKKGETKNLKEAVTKEMLETVPEINNEKLNNNQTNTAKFSPKRPLPSVPEFPRCKVTTHEVSEKEIISVWQTEVVIKIQEMLNVNDLNDILLEDDVNGEWIKHNCTKIGKSGVVQVDKDTDLPYWALSAMTCLANWPHGRETGLPCYPGFEKDVFKAVCAYYCGGDQCGLTQPLLTYDLYELFTNIVCLLQPHTIPTAIEATRYALLLLPSENRRKLHLLLRLLSKMSKNPHLNSLSHGKNMSTRYMLINMFSQRILGCNEEVYLDEILAVQLTKFLIDHHNILMKVPDGIEELVDNQVKRISQVKIRYGDPATDGTYVDYAFINLNGVKMRHHHKGSRKSEKHQHRKSSDIMKSWDKLVTNMKSKPTFVPLNDVGSYATLGKMRKEKSSENFSKHQAKRARSITFSSRLFGMPSSTQLDNEPTKKVTRQTSKKARMKAAQSCPDIPDIYLGSGQPSRINSTSSNNLQEKSNRRGSRVFSDAFNKFRRGRENSASSD